MKISAEGKNIILTSHYQQKLEEVIDMIQEALIKQDIKPTELQWTILINHINEMIIRSEENGLIPKVIPEMFAEVSKEALEIADKTVTFIGNLSIDEKYVLSIHFENAKQN